MEISKKIKLDLDKKVQKVLHAPANFTFFVAIHDFVGYLNDHKIKIPAKYACLKQIYQGLEDANLKTNEDLGHDRYTALRDLNRIKNQEKSENNFFWRKRELFKKMTGEVYEGLKA